MTESNYSILQSETPRYVDHIVMLVFLGAEIIR